MKYKYWLEPNIDMVGGGRVTEYYAIVGPNIVNSYTSIMQYIGEKNIDSDTDLQNIVGFRLDSVRDEYMLYYDSEQDLSKFLVSL